MIEEALKAHIPLIAATTTDTANAFSVLRHLWGATPFSQAGPQVKRWDGDTLPQQIQPKTLYVRIGDLPKTSVEDHGETLHKRFSTAESVFCVVNASKIPDSFFAVGDLPVPDPLVIKELGKFGAESEFDELAPAIGGLTIKEVGWCLRLADDHTREGVSKARKKNLPERQGLAQVTTDIGPYVPFPALADWLDEEGGYFLGDVDPRLVPRGLLFDGYPGTGKTMGAKWLAKEFGVPLYRLTAEEIKNKYVGESEKAMKRAFDAVDRDAPAILLIDEIEKMFAGQNDAGTTVSLMASLLWWLEEHETRVLTVMTCNSKKMIPPEVIRPGRIDRQFFFDGLDQFQAPAFAKFIGDSFDPKPDPQIVDANLLKLYAGETEKVSQAHIAETVKSAVKATIAAKKE